MIKYLFSIVCRAFIPLSSFIVFIITAKIFGPDGRGLFSLGLSLFALTPIFFAMNLGRIFLLQKNRNEFFNRFSIKHYLIINILMSLVSGIVSMVIWLLLYYENNIINFNQIIILFPLCFYYTWSINGPILFAAINKTYEQDKISLN